MRTDQESTTSASPAREGLAADQQFDVREGTLIFWLHPGSVRFDDSKVTPILEADSAEGSILIVKDADNRLKCFHVYIGKGRTDVECDVSRLNPNEPHMFAVTWSVNKGEHPLHRWKESRQQSNQIRGLSLLADRHFNPKRCFGKRTDR